VNKVALAPWAGRKERRLSDPGCLKQKIEIKDVAKIKLVQISHLI
jgi:hypothetical protein